LIICILGAEVEKDMEEGGGDIMVGISIHEAHPSQKM